MNNSIQTAAVIYKPVHKAHPSDGYVFFYDEAVAFPKGRQPPTRSMQKDVDHKNVENDRGCLENVNTRARVQ